MKKFFTEIYGCQMNISDTIELEQTLENYGWKKTLDPTEADSVIINSCAVRQSAEDRVLRRLGYFKFLKKSRSFKLVFMGCVAQKEKEQILRNYPFVDYVVGPKNRHLIPALLTDDDAIQPYKKSLEERTFTSLEESPDAYLDPVKDFKFPYRSFITISNGCSKFCTYCIVPYTRGFEKSIPSQKIFDNVEKLVEQGVKEIYLLGQNVNSYGKDSGDISFAQLLHDISKVKGVERIKFISSHPRDVSEELIDEMAANPLISRNFHLAMQSGSNEILRRMNRQHTYEHFKSLIDLMRSKVPNITVSTDIIVGFPGETELEYQDTVRALEEIRFDHSFIYMYSQRKGTAADHFNDSISLEEKKRRAQELMVIQEVHTKESLTKLLGKEVKVFVERKGREENQYIGFNEYDLRTVFTSQRPNLIGQILDATIEDIAGRTLVSSLKESLI